MRPIVTLLILMLLLAACSNNPDPTATPTLRPGETPQPTAAPTATPIGGQSVEFRLTAPDTGDGNPPRLRIAFAGDFQDFEKISMSRDGDEWSATAELPPGGLVLYGYDHYADGEPFEDYIGKREGHGDNTNVHSRMLVVSPGRDAVTDVVEVWADDRRAVSTGALSGVVVDASTGEPLIDVDVTAGGIHIATDFEGRFAFPSVAVGTQRVTAHTTLGDYSPADAEATVTDGGSSEVTIAMRAAAPVDVTFDVTLPSDTPADAVIRIAGNVWQLGASRIHQNLPRLVQDISLPPLDRVSATRARGTFSLHEGTYASYYFTLSGTYPGHEYDLNGRFAYHEAIITPSQRTISDQVLSWRPQDQKIVELRITTPPDTSLDEYLTVTLGPTHIAARVSPTEFVTYLTGFPGDTLDYYISISDHSEVGEATADGTLVGTRSVVVGGSDTVERVNVERWGTHNSTRALPVGTQTDVLFRASLPAPRDGDDHVTLALVQGGISRSFDLTQLGGGPLWEGTIRLPVGADVTYHLEALAGDVTRRGPDRTLAVEYEGQVVHDWVSAWSDTPVVVGGTRPDYMTGVYTPDLWSDGYQPLTEPTYARIAEHNGGWVALSSVWQYGRILPTPTIESRSVYAPTVRTPRPHIVEQARKAKAAGLKTFLAPQFNMEMVPGFGDQLNSVVSDAFWDGWFEVAEALWLWHADVAAEIDADALMLPGFVFHVYSGPGRFESQESFEAFDARLIGLVDRVREIYSGKLLISGGAEESDLPGAADLVGVTTYDTGKPDLPASASVAEWHAGYDDLFKTALDPLWERWGVPVLFYTINISAPNGGDGDEVEQARQLEGIMRAIDDRPWVAGSFMWAYHMVDQPITSDGLRARLGEAVMAKVYGTFVSTP
jgi:hypothetical protein